MKMISASRISAFPLLPFVTGIDFLPGMTGAKRPAEREISKAAALWPNE
jgi:hypothetical protein